MGCVLAERFFPTAEFGNVVFSWFTSWFWLWSYWYCSCLHRNSSTALGSRREWALPPGLSPGRIKMIALSCKHVAKAVSLQLPLQDVKSIQWQELHHTVKMLQSAGETAQQVEALAAQAARLEFDVQKQRRWKERRELTPPRHPPSLHVHSAHTHPSHPH